MTNALSIRGLEKVYRNGVVALQGIELDVEQGDFFALLGPNGAGKSTTIGIICSLVNKTAGSVEVFGHDLDTELEQAKRCIGIVPQEFNFNQFETCQQILVNQAGYYGVNRRIATQRSEQYLRQLGLWDKRDSPSRFLSGGMKRRLMIARALIHEPKLLILDEPTAGVDIEIRRSMWEFLQQINQQGTTIILTTHYLEEAESLCRNIAIIDEGQIIQHSSMRELLGQLHNQTFILDVRSVFAEQEYQFGDDFHITQLDEHTLEVEIGPEQDLNGLFVLLCEQGIEVVSMRNKTNRLEQLFMNLVGQTVAQREGKYDVSTN